MIKIPGIDLGLSLYLSDEIMQVHVRTTHRKHSVNISFPSHFYICDVSIPSDSFLPPSLSAPPLCVCVLQFSSVQSLSRVRLFATP